MSGEAYDLIWVFLCTVLVILMQAGFLCLETGLVRSKNSINVALKNIGDFCLSSLVFWAVGFGLMFGASSAGLFGHTSFALGGGEERLDAPLLAFFFFQLAFCGTSVTIVSGAVAERTRFIGYALIALVVSALIYPVYGHWAWGGEVGTASVGWLKDLGFVDFAGSTVVHSIGGWVALAAVLVIGPRIGRFDEGGGAIVGHALPLSCLGVFLLWIGWFGFNAGSTLALSEEVPLILVNTLMAAAAGGVVGLGVTWASEGTPNALAGMNGCLAGLVAVTAACFAVTIPEAIVIGSIGSALCVVTGYVLVRLKVDDVVSAVPVHLTPGAWGTLAVALFGDPAVLNTGLGFFDQLGVQAVGVAAAGGLALAVSLPLFMGFHALGLLRVDPEAERIGLNIVEHKASSAMNDLFHAMEGQIRSGQFSPLTVREQFSEAGVIAAQYSRVVDRFNQEVEMRKHVAKNMLIAKERAEEAARAKSDFLANMSHELRTPLNAIIGFSEVMVQKLFGDLGNNRYEGYAADIHRSGTHLLNLINDVLDLSKIEANKMTLSETEIDLQTLIPECVRMVSARPDCAGIAIRMAMRPDLAQLYADPRLVRQILINLLTNAVKYNKPGGDVSVSAERETDGRLAISVSDSGIGMKPEEIPRALEPFGQVKENALVATREGTGLGLPLSHAFVKLHGGTLDIVSTPDRGTTVTVRFPQTRVISDNLAAAQAV